MEQWDQIVYERLRPYRTRTLQDLEQRVGDVPALIESLIKKGKRPRILEVGHGYGSVVMQLLQRFGSSIELHAISKEEFWGGWQVIKRSAILANLISETAASIISRPEIHVGDLNLGLPFPTDYFDLIYSQVSFYLVREKFLFLEECSRILAPQGVGLVDVHPLVLPDVIPELATLLDIRIKGSRIDFWHFIERCSWLHRRFAPWEYLEITKTEHPSLPAMLRLSFNLSELRADWAGAKSIYEVNSTPTCVSAKPL